MFINSKLQDEFHRITTVNLESKFMSKLDEYAHRLQALFHSKGGTVGLRLQAHLLKAPSNANINITRDVIIRCLMVYVGESPEQLFKLYEDADGGIVSQDLAEQSVKIYQVKTETSEGPDEIGIVLEGIKVLTSLGNHACWVCICTGSCLSQGA